MAWRFCAVYWVRTDQGAAVSTQAITFIVGFVVILAAFIAFIRFMSARMSDQIGAKPYSLVERVLIAGIVIGVIGMFQPWFFAGYQLGFFVVLFSTLGFIVWSHITPAPDGVEEPAE
jgi:hypothetical protein